MANPTTDVAAFKELVVQMLNSTDNEIRSAAEKTYTDIPLQTRAHFLLQIYMDATVNTEARSSALLLFRRILAADYNEFWNAVGQESKAHFFERFIEFVTHEETPILRKRLTDIIAEISRNTINEDTTKQEWTGIMQFLELCATSDKPALREIGMQLIESVPNIFGVDQGQYMNGIKQMFNSSLLYEADSQVRTAAVRAFVAFVSDNDEDESVIRQLSQLIPAVIQVCQHVLNTESDDDVPIQCLSDLASSVPKALTPHLDTIAELCLTTIGDPNKDESYRHSALETMVSFCESAASTMRKRGAKYLPPLVQSCLKLMTEFDEDISEWLACDNLNNGEDDEENVTIGETSLDRICCAVGGKTIMQPLLQAINELLKHDDWRYRHAAIMGLSTMGEGCKRQMEPLISQIVDEMVLPRVNDPHPRVRYAVCNCLGQMCTDFAPTIQKKCHEKIVNALIHTVGNLNDPRVAAHAGAALVNFSSDCPKNIINVYLRVIMEKLESVLDATFRSMVESGKKLVLEQVITTIASVADAAQDYFVDFYARLSQPLKYILQNANGKEYKELRGKTMECLSLIGIAVGRSKFSADANEIMQALLSSGLNFDEDDDPEKSYIISSWARLCKILGPEFAQYLPHVMPEVMKAAEFTPNISVVDDDEVGDFDNTNWDFISLGDQRQLGIKTDGLEDKLTACEMLVSFARELGPAFGDYVEPVLTFMIGQLRYLFHDGLCLPVRSAAADSLPVLLMCVKPKGIAAEEAVFNQILPALISSIENETDLEVLADKLFAIASLAEEGSPQLFTAPVLNSICEVVQKQMTRYEERLGELRKSNKDEDYQDEEDHLEQEEAYEQEAGVLARLSDIIHYLFVAFGEQFLPYFNHLNPQFAQLLHAGRPWRDRQWGTCLYDDVIEYGGQPGRSTYQHIFLEPLLNHICDEYPEIRQAAAYGTGILAMKGGPEYAQVFARAVPLLAEAINKPDSRETEEGAEATENAISAVAKIVKYNSSAIDLNAVIPSWIGWLPIWEDADELPYVYDLFADLVENNNPLVLGDNNSNLHKVFEIILHTFSRGAFEGEDIKEPQLAVKQRLANIVKSLHQNNDIFQQILSVVHMNSHQKEVLQSILSL